MIRDRIVVGIRSAKLSEKLQLASELTLDKAVKPVRQSELVRSQQQVLRGEHTKPDTPVEAVVRGRSQTRPTPSAKPKHREPSKTVDKCYRCGRYPTHDKDRCPARDAVCRKCKKRGHFQVVCRFPVAKVSKVQAEESTENGDVFLGALSSKETNPWTVTLHLDNKPLQFHIDTGRSHSNQCGEILGNQLFLRQTRTSEAQILTNFECVASGKAT